ncbi:MULTISPECIES: response regulator transcription factor [unclassified Pseudomonas]|uniref:response regulator transcription factor n=1 Tax=unclassified Pseudomonas TaxID=196821 RepID=UPI000CD1B219|nr:MULTISPECIES: response regulator transcription factor [unclassified Pseudomonas]POA31512.1 DNA-binding response regulator [Pseudomonas sp. GW456-R21]POA70045.1 DNA-binding response regulator [Pseudomonas sp. GW460-R15]
MLSVLIADDHPVVVAAVKMLLAALKDSNGREMFQTILESFNGVEALQTILTQSPDLVVLDLNIPRLGGLELLSRLQRDQSPSRVVVFTSSEPRFYVDRCMRAGALGFVSKTNDLQELRKAVQAVMSGYMYFPQLDSSSVSLDPLQLNESQMIGKLSDRELSIFRYLALGFSNKEIAKAMNLSHKTISTYKTRLIAKLNVKSLVHLREFAIRNQLI